MPREERTESTKASRATPEESGAWAENTGTRTRWSSSSGCALRWLRGRNGGRTSRGCPAHVHASWRRLGGRDGAGNCSGWAGRGKAVAGALEERRGGRQQAGGGRGAGRRRALGQPCLSSTRMTRETSWKWLRRGLIVAHSFSGPSSSIPGRSRAGMHESLDRTHRKMPMPWGSLAPSRMPARSARPLGARFSLQSRT